MAMSRWYQVPAARAVRSVAGWAERPFWSTAVVPRRATVTPPSVAVKSKAMRWSLGPRCDQ